MTNYIFITYQAILLFASDRFLQSSENEASSHLCNVLRLQSKDWPHSRIHMYKTERGIIFYTNDSTSKEGVLLLKQLPHQLRYRKLMRSENGRLILVEENG